MARAPVAVVVAASADPAQECEAVTCREEAEDSARAPAVVAAWADPAQECGPEECRANGLARAVAVVAWADRAQEWESRAYKVEDSARVSAIDLAQQCPEEACSADNPGADRCCGTGSRDARMAGNGPTRTDSER